MVLQCTWEKKGGGGDKLLQKQSQIKEWRHVIKKDGALRGILCTWLKNRTEIVLYVNTVNNNKINFTQQLCVWILHCYPLLKTHTTSVNVSNIATLTSTTTTHNLRT